VSYSRRRLSTRSLTTVFGTVEWNWFVWLTSKPGAPSIFPLDKALALPARSFSYELQRRLVKAAVQNPFLESNSNHCPNWTALVVVESQEQLRGQKRGIAVALRKAKEDLRKLERRAASGRIRHELWRSGSRKRWAASTCRSSWWQR